MIYTLSVYAANTEGKRHSEMVRMCVCAFVSGRMTRREGKQDGQEAEMNCSADLYSGVLQAVQQHRCSSHPRAPETLAREIQSQQKARKQDPLIVPVMLRFGGVARRARARTPPTRGRLQPCQRVPVSQTAPQGSRVNNL